VRPRRGSSAVHDGLVGARALVGTRYLDDPALRAEYARDIAPRTEVALARILAEVYREASEGDIRRPARALDLGAGTGAVGRTLEARFGPELEMVAVDAVPAPGVLRVDLVRDLPSGRGRFDLIVAAHLLNELFLDRPPDERAELRARRVLAWSGALLAPGGTLILIEPALRETSRGLLEVRDLVLGRGLRIVAPCFWTGACPALARERDWCHDAAPADGGRRVDFSYLVLREGPPGQAEDASILRVVSDPMPDKGRLRLFGCGTGGRHLLVRLDRHASETNATFGKLERGDVVRVQGGVSAGDGLRITAESTVSLR
jgi:SAM-dependent methyltransferase